MISPVRTTPRPVTQPTSAAQAQSSTPSAAAKPAQSKPQPSTDTVSLSTTAQAFAQEATETPVQTRKEAMSGDTQAQRLLAKEAATQASVNLSV